MNPHSHLDVLLTHDRWATEQVLGVSGKLTVEQFDRPFPIGRGSLRATLSHIIEVIDGWHCRTTGRSPRPPFASQVPVAELAGSFDVIHRNFADYCRAAAPDAVWTAVWNKRTFTAPAAVIMTHVATHSMHHRAQAINMHRQLGVDPLPQSSITEWARTTAVATTTLQN